MYRREAAWEAETEAALRELGMVATEAVPGGFDAAARHRSKPSAAAKRREVRALKHAQAAARREAVAAAAAAGPYRPATAGGKRAHGGGVGRVSQPKARQRRRRPRRVTPGGVMRVDGIAETHSHADVARCVPYETISIRIR